MRSSIMQAAGRVAKPERILGVPPGWWWAGSLIVGVMITVVSLLPPRGTPGPQIADLGELVATIGHFVGYLLLAALIMLAQRMARAWLVWAAVSAYGAFIEVAQGTFGLRSFQWTDILANAVGAAVGVCGAGVMSRWWMQRTSPQGRGRGRGLSQGRMG